jgi:hypothetical protein
MGSSEISEAMVSPRVVGDGIRAITPMAESPKRKRT